MLFFFFLISRVAILFQILADNNEELRLSESLDPRLERTTTPWEIEFSLSSVVLKGPIEVCVQGLSRFELRTHVIPSFLRIFDLVLQNETKGYMNIRLKDIKSDMTVHEELDKELRDLKLRYQEPVCLYEFCTKIIRNAVTYPWSISVHSNLLLAEQIFYHNTKVLWIRFEHIKNHIIHSTFGSPKRVEDNLRVLPFSPNPHIS